MSDTMAREGTQLATTAVDQLMRASTSITNVIQSMLDNPRGPLAYHVQNGGQIGAIDVPSECVENVLIACNESRIPVQISGKNNLLDTRFVTILFRDYNDVERDAAYRPKLDEHGNEIKIGGDRSKIEDIVASVCKEYDKTREMSTEEANKEWAGSDTVRVSDLTLRQAELYQKQAKREGIETFLRYSEESGKFSLEVKAAHMERHNPNVPSIGEEWLTHCALLQSIPDINKYVIEEDKTDEMIRDCFTNIKNGTEYEPITIYCTGTTTQELNCRSHITLEGNFATYSFFEENENGELIGAMDSVTYDLNSKEERDMFLKRWETIGPHAAMEAVEYKAAIEEFNRGNFIGENWKEMEKELNAYEKYLNGLEYTVPVLEKFDKLDLVELEQKEIEEQGKRWRAYETRIPNSEKVISLLLNEAQNIADDQTLKDLEEGMQLASTGLKTTMSSQFVSSPSYMKKEISAITREEDGLIDREFTQSATAQEVTAAEIAGNPDELETEIKLEENGNGFEEAGGGFGEPDWDIFENNDDNDPNYEDR